MQGVYTTSENSIKEMKLMDKIADRLLEELNCNTVFTIPIFGGIGVSESVVVTWIIMAVMILTAFILTRNLKTTHISKRQAVAEFRQTTLFVPIYSASFFSKSFVFGPVVIQPLLNVSTTSAISSSVISGGEKAICIFSIKILLSLK